MANALPKLLARQPSGTVALFGEVLADRFPDGDLLGGAPFNVARHLKAFGLNPILVTRVGNDELKEMLMARMAEFGMETLGVQIDPEHPTGQVLVHFEEGAHRFEIAPDQAYDHIDAVVAKLVSLSIQPDLVYFGTLAQRNKVSRRALCNLLRCDAPRMLDVNLREPWYNVRILKQSLQRASFVKMNREELEKIARMLDLPGKNCGHFAEEILSRFSIRRLIVTCGASGAWQKSDRGAETRSEGVEPVGIVDTVGAGDGFTAVCILGMLKGWSEQETIERANRFASGICEIRGAIPENMEFYAPHLREWGF